MGCRRGKDACTPDAAKYRCEKCGARAEDKKGLCRPERLAPPAGATCPPPAAADAAPQGGQEQHARHKAEKQRLKGLLRAAKEEVKVLRKTLKKHREKPADGKTDDQ